MKQTNILLESDTNELEIVEFRVDELDSHGNLVPCHYGVNVAKVREIIRLPQLTKALNTSEAVEGMIKLREKVIPVLNLSKILNKYTGDLLSDRVIVLEFNNVMVGVLVHSVSRIYRISWKNVEAPASSLYSDQVTGLVKMDDRIILVLDFEKIVAEFCASSALKPLSAEQLLESAGVDRSSKTILVADDSPFIRHTMCAALRGAGYNVEEAVNGAEAWEKIQKRMQICANDGVSFRSKMQLLITDVEMPQMDGLHLTSLIRKEDSLKELPIIIFSSLASDDNIRKWHDLGAQQILTKPDLPNLVKYADEYTL
ncbi:two-component system, chemotaxis family, response regulator CheV [Trichlorobacter thiogenes]|uniref:Two-component system, chemotaxis family, response regulator CheV n=1 Tax=Trichlorobacter thiogenes TaxID=115783 RepID=A0A1T4RVM0_9BACT|nr:chemotaxis protein [Trichlorobacter thiogenes]SKA19641.1 two-component system, chemotaxis family, response regulator CheV [Trichlorobacter thiogenes]